MRRSEFGKLSFYLPTAFPALLVAIGLTATATSSTIGTASRPADLVISQIYGGGGQPGSIWTADFIELTNRGDDPVDLAGWSVQYAPPRERSWGMTTLSGTVPAGGRYLIAQAGGPDGATELPSAAVAGTLDLGATSGKVALVHGVEPLRCVASCTKVKGVRDFVGYGSADDAEGRAAPPLSTTTSIVRRDTTVPADQGTSAIEDDPGGPAGVESGKQRGDGIPGVDGDGGVDSGNNAADFVVATPAPPGGRGDKAGRTARIADIQGRSHLSPLAGRLVTSVPGVVTAVGRTGFWMQDAEPDDDPATSDGLFVFTGTAPRVKSGDTVKVAGTVTEYRPGGSAGADNLTTTELIRPTVRVDSSAARRPVPVLIGQGGRMPPTQIRSDAPGDVESSRLFAPTLNALDFYESLEGMLVRLDNPVVVGPTSIDGQLPVLPTGAASARTARGGLRFTDTDPNTERLVLDDLLAPLPVANVGDRLRGAVEGVLDYGSGDYRVELLSPPTLQPGSIVPETARPPKSGELTVSSIDVSGATPTGERGRVRRLATTVVRGLRSPDVLVVTEMPGDRVGTDGSDVDPDAPVGAQDGWTALTAAIRAAGGPRYEFRQVDPVSQRDGSGGENRRLGFLFNPARVSFVDRGAGDATTSTEVVTEDGRVALSLSPGRVAPAATAFRDARKSLAGEFRFRGRTVFVVGNHFVSGRGDEPLYGRQQPPHRTSEQQRGSQATAVRTFVDSVLRADENAAVVVVGGIADTDGSPTLGLLTADGGLNDLAATLPAPDRYSVVAEGNAVLLDHILVSAALRGTEIDIVHAQSEFASRWTDRDPLVGYLDVPEGSDEDSASSSPPATP